MPSWRSCQKGEKTTRDGRRTGRLCPALCAVAQQVIREDQRHHGLADGHGADADTGIVTALGHHVDLFALRADAAARDEDRTRRLDGEAGDEVLAGRNAAEPAARVVGEAAYPAARVALPSVATPLV